MNGHAKAVGLLLDGGADAKAKDKVNTCECTVTVSGSLICLSVSCVGIYIVIDICNRHYSLCSNCHCIMITVVVGCGRCRMEGLLLFGPLKRDMWKL